MKKALVFGFMFALVVVCYAVAFAQTTVDVEFDGGGWYNIDVVAGDDATSFVDINASFASGGFHFVDKDDNPYSYNVDTTTSFLGAQIVDGTIQYEYLRQDDKTGGGSGQRSYTLISVDGIAELAFGQRSNYHDMTNCQYGWVYSGSSPYDPTSNGVQFQAAGLYGVYHSLQDSSGDGAFVNAWGDGSVDIKMMGQKSQGSSFNFGHLSVCGDGEAWDNNYAVFDGDGQGEVVFRAWADNQISVHEGGIVIPGGGTGAIYDLDIVYNGVWSYPDFGLSGN
ncbi:MAG: hypothetical protein U9Q96_02095 [Patescibacteria group bacterium]|nr:hypothetical protein [Patescibacteria group bacterium]